ncbi:MAG TPA: MaoC family dehydratase [Candidatus Acidoferrales bacterium]|nr:MaoC family dehydratase [Candidatus Acidoferrales bacterium]
MSAAAAVAEIRVGKTLKSGPYVLDAGAAKLYGAAIDGPPRQRPPAGIHDDQDAARRAGFVAPIAGGEQTIAIVAQFLADQFGMRFARGGRLEVTLTRPVLFGDTLTSHASITAVDAERATLSVRVENQHGEEVLVGNATVRAAGK